MMMMEMMEMEKNDAADRREYEKEAHSVGNKEGEQPVQCSAYTVLYWCTLVDRREKGRIEVPQVLSIPTVPSRLQEQAFRGWFLDLFRDLG